MTRAAVLGTGSWGTAFGKVLADAGTDVVLWARRPELAQAVRDNHENADYLPGVILPANLTATSDPLEAVADADFVVLAVPSQSLRENLAVVAAALSRRTVLVSLMKGVELGTTKRMSEVIREVADVAEDAVAVVTGPNLAKEIAAGQPAATVVACTDGAGAERLQGAAAAAARGGSGGSGAVGRALRRRRLLHRRGRLARELGRPDASPAVVAPDQGGGHHHRKQDRGDGAHRRQQHAPRSPRPQPRERGRETAFCGTRAQPLSHIGVQSCAERRARLGPLVAQVAHELCEIRQRRVDRLPSEGRVDCRELSLGDRVQGRFVGLTRSHHRPS